MMEKIKRILNMSTLPTIIILLTMSILIGPLSTTSVPTKDNVNTWKWSSTSVISTGNTDVSREPEVAIDGANNIHVVWEDKTNYSGAGTDKDVFYAKYNTSTESWSTTELISTVSTAESSNPQIAIDSDDNIHVTWDDETDYNNADKDDDIFYTRFSTSTESWSSTEVVSAKSTMNSRKPSIAIGSFGPHIVWKDITDINGAGPDSDVFYSKLNLFGNWDSPTILSDDSAAYSDNPQIAVDSDNDIHVTWDDEAEIKDAGTASDIFYTKFSTSTGSWSSTEVLSTGEYTSGVPTIAVDSTDKVHIAWYDYNDYNGAGFDTDIFYTRFNPSTESWSSIEVISSVSTNDSSVPKIATDTADNAHLLWYDETDYNGAGRDNDIFYAKYNATTESWSQVFDISENPTASEYPALKVDPSGVIHVFWGDKTDYNGEGTDSDIFYRKFYGTPNNPEVELLSPNPGYDDVVLEWGNINFAQSYNIYRSNSTINQSSLLATTQTSEFVDTTVKTGTYIYYVKAVNSVGESSKSNLIAVDILGQNTQTTTETTNQSTIQSTTKTITDTTTHSELQTVGDNTTGTNFTSEAGLTPYIGGVTLIMISLISIYQRRKRQ